MRLFKIRPAFSRLSGRVKIAAGVALVAAVFAVDYLTGNEISFSIFYLLPVMLVTVMAGWGGAVVVSFASGAAWLLADRLAGAHYSAAWIPFWNTAMRVMIFMLVARLLVSFIAARDLAGKAEAEARRVTQAKSDFLANMSHEIRTPLNAMLGVAHLLDETGLTARQRELTRIFRTEGEQLRRLINDVLDLSKAEAGRFQLEVRPFHLGQMAQAIIQTFSPAAAEKGLRLESVIAPAADRAWLGDGHRLRQVLANLLGNAIKFTETGGVVLRIAAAESGGAITALKFEVEDTGIGIDPKGQALLFQRYEQLGNRAANLSAGTGLGLSISRALVQAMGGDLRLDSETGRGSTFHFTLPLALAAADAEPPPAPSPCALRTSALAGKSVLLVEDHKVNRMVFAEYLGAAGCRVTPAANGREGVELFSAGVFDAVIMDMQMPVLDGWSATREIRAWERQRHRPATPVIALTAAAMHEERERCREAGCTRFLAKPLTKTDLLRALAEVMGGDTGKPADTGSEAVPDDLRTMFLDDTKIALAGIRHALAATDWPQIERLGHQLAGSGTTFGFPQITALGRACEAAAAGRNERGVREVADALETFFTTLPTP